MNNLPAELAWEKMQGLVPAIIQDATTAKVLMLGFMNREALEQTIATNFVTFFSRSKQRLWVKGETSKNKLQVVNITADCDQDSLLILANPLGPTCHLGEPSCFKSDQHDWGFLQDLESIIQSRREMRPDKSYLTTLFDNGLNAMTQKVGEEAVETIIAALNGEEQQFLAESADLFFHFLVLLSSKQCRLSQVIAVLKDRRK